MLRLSSTLFHERAGWETRDDTSLSIAWSTQSNKLGACSKRSCALTLRRTGPGMSSSGAASSTACRVLSQWRACSSSALWCSSLQ